MSSSHDSIQSQPVQKPTSWKRRCRRFFVIYAVVPYVSIVVIMGLAQRWMIYHPTKTDRLLARTAEGPDLRVEDVTIHTSDGLTLYGWRFRREPVSKSAERFLVLYFPGNAGCRGDRVGDCRDFTQLGCDVVLFDYRGYGDNKGSPSEAGMAADATQVWSFVTSELHIPPRQIIFFAESLGGGVATRLAAEVCKAGTPPAALILNSTFASLAETVAWHYPAFPFQYLLLDRYPSSQRIRDVTCPILQFHGTADTIVPFTQGQRLFNAAPDKSWNGIEKQFVEIPGGQHNFISIGHMHLAVKQLLKQIE